MNIGTLLTTLSQAIAANATLNAWGTTTYGKTPKVFVDAIPGDAPQASDAPYTLITKLAKAEGQTVDPMPHTFLIRCAVYDATIAASGYANLTIYYGGGRLETMRGYVRNAVTGASLGNLTVDEIRTEYNPVEAFPWFTCDMTVTIGEAYVIGDNPFE